MAFLLGVLVGKALCSFGFPGWNLNRSNLLLNLGGMFLRFWFLSGDGLTLRVLPFEIRSRDDGGSMALAGLARLSFGLPVFKNISFLTLILSDLSLLTAVVL